MLEVELRQMPDATLSISEALSSAMLESLINGRLDIAALCNARSSPNIELTALQQKELFLVQARDQAWEPALSRCRG